MGAAKDQQYLNDLGAAIDAASVVPGEVAATSGLPGFQNAIVVADELPPMPDEIIEGILLEGHKMLLTGPSKAHKTWGLIALAVSLATGGYWMGFRCAKRRVLYVDLETDPRTLQRRISTVASAKGSNVEDVRAGLSIWPLRGQSCGLAQIRDELFVRCKPGEFGMVIIDPAYMVQDGDENNARDIREFFAVLDEICMRLQTTIVISHHHSKGAQGLKSAIDRGSGSGVFGRAPDAVLDLTQLVLEPGTLQMLSEVKSFAATSGLTGWRVSFTLREFAPKDALDVWFKFPLHEPDTTGLLEDCKPNYGGVSEQRKMRLEAEGLGKVASLDAVCQRLVGDGDYAYRDEVVAALGWSISTVNRWLEQSKRFMRQSTNGNGKAKIVRRPTDGGEGKESGEPSGEEVTQDELPLNPFTQG
ncbi:MAG: AAA family ATPase [Eggerthellaceae bacterium]|nr:AAA family ATPase [Eggerthellaceae bacterium]